jgi:very-short-patch-repair endonuclease
MMILVKTDSGLPPSPVKGSGEGFVAGVEKPEAAKPTPNPSLVKEGGGQMRFLHYDKKLVARARENKPLWRSKALGRKLVARARENRKNPTPAESLIWNKVLRHRQFECHKFARQKPIGRYIVDFYCAELRLVVEIDGDSHAAQAAYDEKRTQALNQLGLTVIRYANRDVLSNLEGVFEDFSSRVAQLAAPVHSFDEGFSA